MLYTNQDNALIGDPSMVLGFSNGDSVQFQFPPRILSDNRRGTWNEGELRGTEPVATLATSGPRLITLNWTYIVDSLDPNSKSWPATRIKQQILKVRGYFGRLRDPDQETSRAALTVQFRMWSLGGAQPISARIVSVDVKHGETLVGSDDGAFPLRTDVTVDLRLWTSGDSNTGALAQGALTETEFTQVVAGMDLTFPPDWY